MPQRRLTKSLASSLALPPISITAHSLFVGVARLASHAEQRRVSPEPRRGSRGRSPAERARIESQVAQPSAMVSRWYCNMRLKSGCRCWVKNRDTTTSRAALSCGPRPPSVGFGLFAQVDPLVAARGARACDVAACRARSTIAIDAPFLDRGSGGISGSPAGARDAAGAAAACTRRGHPHDCHRARRHSRLR